MQKEEGDAFKEGRHGKKALGKRRSRMIGSVMLQALTKVKLKTATTLHPACLGKDVQGLGSEASESCVVLSCLG